MATNQHNRTTLQRVQAEGFDRSRLDGLGDRTYVTVACSECEALVINGTPTHERGCRNTPVACRECGFKHADRQSAAECCQPEAEWDGSPLGTRYSLDPGEDDADDADDDQ